MFFFKPKLHGMIGYLHLERFWYSLTDEEQKKITKYSKGGLSTGKDKGPTEGDVLSYSGTQLKYLSPFIGWATRDKQWELADKIISCCDTADGSLIDMHFFYLDTINCYYAQIKTREDAIEKTIEYCKKDIDLFPKYKRPLMKDMGGKLPHIPSFQKLVMCYEKQGKYSEAIAVCKQAMKHNIQDTTESGFAGRIERLGKKMK